MPFVSIPLFWDMFLIVKMYLSCVLNNKEKKKKKNKKKKRKSSLLRAVIEIQKNYNVGTQF